MSHDIDVLTVGGATDHALDLVPPERRSLRRRWLAIGLVAAILIGALAVGAGWTDQKVDVRAGTSLVDGDGLAARYGIDITLIGVTAAGGMIDFRYQVVDPDKANALIHDLTLYPKLIVEDTGETLILRSLPHNHGVDLKLGGTYFFLLANARNAIHAGSRLTVVMGDARLEHLIVQG